MVNGWQQNKGKAKATDGHQSNADGEVVTSDAQCLQEGTERGEESRRDHGSRPEHGSSSCGKRGRDAEDIGGRGDANSVSVEEFASAWQEPNGLWRPFGFSVHDKSPDYWKSYTSMKVGSTLVRIHERDHRRRGLTTEDRKRAMWKKFGRPDEGSVGGSEAGPSSVASAGRSRASSVIDWGKEVGQATGCRNCESSKHRTGDCPVPNMFHGDTAVDNFCDRKFSEGGDMARDNHPLDSKRSANPRLAVFGCSKMIQHFEHHDISTLFKHLVLARLRKPALRVRRDDFCFFHIVDEYSVKFCNGLLPPEMGGKWPYTKSDAIKYSEELKRFDEIGLDNMPRGELEGMHMVHIREALRHGRVKRQVYSVRPGGDTIKVGPRQTPVDLVVPRVASSDLVSPPAAPAGDKVNTDVASLHLVSGVKKGAKGKFSGLSMLMEPPAPKDGPQTVQTVVDHEIDAAFDRIIDEDEDAQSRVQKPGANLGSHLNDILDTSGASDVNVTEAELFIPEQSAKGIVEGLRRWLAVMNGMTWRTDVVLGPQDVPNDLAIAWFMEFRKGTIKGDFLMFSSAILISKLRILDDPVRVMSNFVNDAVGHADELKLAYLAALRDWVNRMMQEADTQT